MLIPKGNPDGNNFGEHLMIDGYQANYEQLNDRENVRRSIQLLPERLGMKTLSHTEVYHAVGNNLKDPGGWTGFVVIEESHISVHTFPGIGFVSIDAYTCKNGLDTEAIVKWFQEHFGIKVFELNLIQRGQRFSEFCS
jgi:S-adenosylmethionine decarboxylase